MFESAWARRFFVLPMTLAIAVFAIGAAGFVVTAGTPSYRQRTAALADVVFASPSTQVDLAAAVPPFVLSAEPEMPKEAPIFAEAAVPQRQPAIVTVIAQASPTASTSARTASNPVSPTPDATVSAAAVPDSAPVYAASVAEIDSATASPPAVVRTAQKVAPATTTPPISQGNLGTTSATPQATPAVSAPKRAPEDGSNSEKAGARGAGEKSAGDQGDGNKGQGVAKASEHRK
ncbi:MAG: hypothetical protein ABIP13_09805 [Tepidiformaceae bacterium]